MNVQYNKNVSKQIYLNVFINHLRKSLHNFKLYKSAVFDNVSFAFFSIVSIYK